MNVGEWPTKWAARYPDETAIKYSNLVLSKAAFNQRINRLAHALAEAGIKEYWRRPEETAEAITDGWLHSGDIGYFDEEGYLYLLDRRKDMYISGGENVYPAEVEDVIMGMPEVADCGVIGIADAKWGEVGLAVVVKKPGTDTTKEAVIDFCHGKLAGYKRPRQVVFADSLPRTLTGKILKKDLRAKYVNGDRFVAT